MPIDKDSFEMEAKDEEKILLNRLNEINKNNRTILLALRDKTKLYAAVKKIDDKLGKIKVKSITETNDLIYCGAVLVTDMVGVKIGKTGIKKEPWWKRRLEGQIKDIRRKLSWVNEIKENKPIKKKNLETLQRKYKLKETKLLGIKEKLIQKFKAKSGKIKRYDQRIKQYHQNRQFRNNESVFYSRLNSEDVHVTSEIPGKKEAKDFWSNLWSKNGTHNENAKWLKDFKTSMNGKPK